MNSGNFGAVTTGSGTVFGAQALLKTKASRRVVSLAQAWVLAERIEPILAQTIEQTPRHVGDDRHLSVARLVQHDARVAVDPPDPLLVGRRIGIEGQGDADH